MSAWEELTFEQLDKLPTNRLFNVFKIARQRFYYYDYNEFDYSGEKQTSKQLTDLKNKVEYIKSLLDNRGHIDRDKGYDTFGKSKKPVDPRTISMWLRPEPAKKLVGSIADLESAIGKQVFKKSKKPFKSKNFYNTVKSVTTNPHTNRDAFTFEEDSSIVDSHVCNIRPEKK